MHKNAFQDVTDKLADGDDEDDYEAEDADENEKLLELNLGDSISHYDRMAVRQEELLSQHVAARLE